MMVTFISECEKKAHNRTRRVLDAFADRIGNNTWQTVITQEGLLAVKKLLRKTATKNTAVSCHWMRSRKRSEVVWMVGNRKKFNAQGVVPVNRTKKEVFMDFKQEKPIKGVMYANTHLQRLDHHLFAVGYVAQKLYLHFYSDKNKQADAAFISGCFHDIGKLDPCFQKWVTNPKNTNYLAQDGQHIDETKFSFEKHPRHNEISVLIFHCLSDRTKGINPSQKKSIKHAVYWHHAKPFRPKNEGDFNTYGQIFSKLKKTSGNKAVTLISNESMDMLNSVIEIDKSYRNADDSILSKSFEQEFDDEILESYEYLPLPKYKEYSDSEDISTYKNKIRENANNNEIRACLITADRWISALAPDDLAAYIENKNLNDFIFEQLENNVFIESDLTSSIHECISKFPDSDRSKQQSNVAKKLAEDYENPKVLAGAAGCGKTKIALEWAGLRVSQQIIWVCPRVQICQGMFTELKASDEPYLQNATVEIFTGEFKFTNAFNNPTPEDQQLTADIVITTIDQLLSSVISHTKADRLLNYLSAHIVFDEYHEYINMPAFNLLFAELVESRRRLKSGCNILLVSATPHYFYLEHLLGLDVDYDVEEMPSFNDKEYQFDFFVYDETKDDDTNPLYQKHDLTTFSISNTATTAQKSFIHNLSEENAVLLHSKYKKSDKKRLFDSVFQAFKREGSKAYDTLRSGPIVQASLNISCDYMVSEITTAENCLQRMGRLDRFGLNENINRYTLAVPETFHKGKGTGALSRFLSSTSELEASKAWYQFLVEKTDNGKKTQSISDVYRYYKDFYSLDSVAMKAIKQDMEKALKESAKIMAAKVTEPQTMVTRKKEKAKRTKISSNSLRGDSRFVQMAICSIEGSQKYKFVDAYAYEIPTSESAEVDNLTSSCDLIQGYGDSNNNLLTHMMKKHHNITAEPKAYKDFILLNEAKDSESPVYLSYTTNDLLAVGGETARHSSAIYYGICEKQPIGAISIKQLTNQED